MQNTSPFWIEVNLRQLRENLNVFCNDKPPHLKWCSVVKDQAYGHGAVKVAKETLAAGASMLAVSSLSEAIELRSAFPKASILIFGERAKYELEACVENGFVIFVNDVCQAHVVEEIGKKHDRTVNVQLEIDTGLSRYGIRWTEVTDVVDTILKMKHIKFSGVMTHFAMSDELDKTFANQQFDRFKNSIEPFRNKKKLSPSAIFHACNTGGYLDLPKAHLDMVRIGILPLGVYPSQVCRRLDGLQPVMMVKTKVATIKKIQANDVVGYGMHYRADQPRTIAVLCMGYGSGFPRVRNKGHVLIQGKRAPIIGGNAMNSIIVDVTDIPEARVWDEVVVLGNQKEDKISIHDLAGWGNTVSYEIMTRWNANMPRIYLG